MSGAPSDLQKFGVDAFSVVAHVHAELPVFIPDFNLNPARLGVPFYAAGTMPSRAWPAQECPLCADGVPVTPDADDGRSAPPAGR